MIGANLNHDVGYLDFGRTGALEFMVMGDEFISQARRFMLGVPVNDETLALEVVEAGAKGQPYLTNPHTLRHLPQRAVAARAPQTGLITKNGAGPGPRICAKGPGKRPWPSWTRARKNPWTRERPPG